MYSASVDRGADYMENIGRQPKGRRLRSNEFVDQRGYIRRERSSAKGIDLWSTIMVLSIVFIVIGIVKYWEKILFIIGGLIILGLIISLIIYMWRKR